MLMAVYRAMREVQDRKVQCASLEFGSENRLNI